MNNLTKNQRTKLFEHKNKTRGSLRVYKNNIFYNLGVPIKRMKISDDISSVLVIPSVCKKGLVLILNRLGIQPEATTINGKRLKKRNQIEGLEYDSIKTIKGDHDNLRLNYSTFEEHGEEYLAEFLQEQAKWLDKNGIKHGESDGTFACIRGKCLSLEDLKEMQKKLVEYSK